MKSGNAAILEHETHERSSTARRRHAFKRLTPDEAARGGRERPGDRDEQTGQRQQY